MSNILALTTFEKFFLFLFLFFYEIIIFVIDQNLGAGISVRPLFVVPIIISSFFINLFTTLAFALFSAILHVVSYRLSDFSSDISFKYFPNLISNFVGYLIVALVISWCSTYYRKFHILQSQIIEDKVRSLTEEPE